METSLGDCYSLSFLLMILRKKLPHQVRSKSTTDIFHFPFLSFQVVLMQMWPMGSFLQSLGNVLHYFSDYLCSATAAASLSDCYSKTTLHVHGDQCRKILLGEAHAASWTFAHSSCWTSMSLSLWGQGRSRHGSSCLSAPAMPQHGDNAISPNLWVQKNIHFWCCDWRRFWHN